MSDRTESFDLAQSQASDTLAYDDVQSLLKLYLIALWGQEFSLQGDLSCDDSSKPDSTRPMRAALDGPLIRLPGRMSGQGGLSARAVFLATAAHAAAHRLFSGPLNPEALNARQRFLIELVEDARIEFLVADRFPGLRRWWLALHPPDPPDPTPFTAVMWRLSRGLLLLKQSDDDDFLVRKAIDLFLARRDRMNDPLVAREVGLRLAHDIGQMRLSMDEGCPPPLAVYRDDNRHLWVEERPQLDEQHSASNEMDIGEQPGVDFEESTEGSQLAFTEASLVVGAGPAGYRVEVEPEAARLSFLQQVDEARDATSRYPEWFERFGVERADWCTVTERPADEGVVDWADAVIAKNRGMLASLRRVVTALRTRHMMRVRKQEQGDELDLDAALRAIADLRDGREPDMRVHMSNRPQNDQALALSVLLDLSESVNQPDPLSGRPILDLAREAVLLLASTVTGLGSPLALAGFHSNGRHQVDVQRIKGFEESFDDSAQARLAGLTGCYSTRMGAAIRHAIEGLARQEAHHRILLVVTDGEPSDIDVFDSEHLLHDTRHAVMQARRSGLQVFCVSLDPEADRYVERIFGAGHYLVLDHLAQLPERLSSLLLRLVRSGF